MLVDATAVQNLPAVSCIDKCTPIGMQLAVLISLACQWGGLSTDTATLEANAKCFQCIPIGMRMGVLISLAQQLSGTSSQVNDPDVAAFIGPAGITDPKTISALDKLVGDLKFAGVWTLFDAIYPFVGGTANSNSYNLINTAKYQITWHGGMTFNANGITGDGATGYGDTGYNPFVNGVSYTLNSASVGVYCRSNPMIGTATGAGFGSETLFSGSGAVLTAAVNNFGITSNPVFWNGNLEMSRTGVNTATLYLPDGTTAADGAASASVPNASIYVSAFDLIGTGATGFSNASLAFHFIGAGFTGAQMTAIRSAILTFETALGRA